MKARKFGVRTGPPAIINERTERVPIDSVRLHPRNPRRGDVDKIVESMVANGVYGSILVQESTGFIIVGNHTWQAQKRLGLKEISVTFADVDDDRAMRIMLADNKSSDDATNDDELLAELLRDCEESEAGLLGTLHESPGPEEETELTPVSIQKPPTTTWVLIGIPTVRFGEIASRIEDLATVDEIFCEVTANADGQ